ncbi:xanthine dehydrogenase YagR molybdenum-binding subunit [Tranquillimonas rosea]|uniref:Xanthine dehydrogenase YagR molybdenum-binding subunit n=1 Tax=Tranquillimonas rosea TaxID=641238 RepID=A0A1H9PEJ5_9RHOB|nr:xanthine dehydrogenase family protein molybdopterin-binding subunit [Tranquillimonas rosea]SER46624.1 xanthine dehydrogenase YagR molybdenum-binding subunit [Tranquillimonas rosea]
MTRHLRMDEPQARLLDETGQGVLSTPLPRPEGPLKVTGRARYAAEVTMPDMAVGVLVRATIPAGRVTGMNTSEVMAMPGVLGVWHGGKMLRNPAQGTANAAPVQPGDKVAYYGQPIAVVVAETFEDARAAGQALKIAYAPSNAEPDPDTAATVETAEGLDQGDLEAAMDSAAYSIDAAYTTPGHSSAPMEPHAALAAWEGDNLVVHGSYQMLKYNVNELADSLGIPPENVRIHAPYVGGGFGSKLGIAPEAVAASIASKELGRPVRVAMARQDVFEMTMRRSETRQRVRLAAGVDGVLTGLGHEDRVSNLPGESFAEPTVQATHFLYGGENRRYVQEIARVNRTCAGSVRAPGEAVGMLALENAMDELAEAMHVDPVDLRLRNIPDTHPESGVPYSARSLAECLRDGAERFGWSERGLPGERREGEWLIGMGVASAARANFIMESEARVTLNPDGTALVETDMTDIGTGSYAILGQIAAEMLGLPMDKVKVDLGDSAMPPASGSGGSFGAASAGSSVYLAAQEIRAEIARKLDCADDDLTLRDGNAVADNRKTALTELIDAPMVGHGHLEPGKTAESHSQAGYGAHFSEVAVNEVTGEVRVRRMLSAFAVGRVLNQRTATSQGHGGMIWGIGTALTEELQHDPRDGRIVNRDLAEYHVPVNLDVPDLDVMLIEERDDESSPIQAKGIGELGLSGVGAAITNAIYNACGVRVRDYPATPDKILAAL